MCESHGACAALDAVERDLWAALDDAFRAIRMGKRPKRSDRFQMGQRFRVTDDCGPGVYLLAVIDGDGRCVLVNGHGFRLNDPVPVHNAVSVTYSEMMALTDGREFEVADCNLAEHHVPKRKGDGDGT